ncbi:YfhO family protein [Holzapfeliella sp. He02]|uniref:YfhO family protein n=1 Tax=Holzapfeliella saturejae TaxID=3082953 RepID=A0ABU8SHA9_9LACO
MQNNYLTRLIKVDNIKTFKWLSFLLPFILFLIYFALRGAYPFGDNSILTVDLGQQYIDFLAYFKHTLTQNPNDILYSFSKGLGGAMAGTWAYYLLSPFNLILLLVPTAFFPTGIFLIILTKIGFIGLSSFHYFHRRNHLNGYATLALSTAYAMCGFVVANNFNLMWLDSVILLPILIQTIDDWFTKPQFKKLLLVTCALLITNFYSGYMALLFGFFYYITLWIINRPKNWGKLFIKYAATNILSALLTAFVLIPTVLELLTGKGQSQGSQFELAFQYPPQNTLAKLMIGSFDFNQMSYGMPNVYFSSLLLLAVIGFFMNKAIAKRTRIALFGLFFFMIASLSFIPLVLMWHMGQFPVWFPGRFTFCLVFLCLILASDYLKNIKFDSNKTWIVQSILVVAAIIFVAINLAQFTFLDWLNIGFTAVFFAMGIYLYKRFNTWGAIAPILLMVLVTLDLSSNFAASLNNISYQSNSAYVNYSRQNADTSKKIKESDDSFYRTEKTYYRSNDDPFSGLFNGISHFNSLTPYYQSIFLNRIGLKSAGSSYSYGNGTVLTDSLLGVKYYYTYADNSDDFPFKTPNRFASLTTRPDLDTYQKIMKNYQIDVYKNDHALPISFIAPENSSEVSLATNRPILNQEELMSNLLNKQVSYFKKQPEMDASLTNVSVEKSLDTTSYHVMEQGKPATVEYSFTPETNDPYYLLVPNFFDNKQVKIYINDILVSGNSLGGNENRVLNVASNQKGVKVTVKLELQKDFLSFSLLSLYRFDNASFKTDIDALKATPTNTKQLSNTHYTSDVELSESQRFMTSIPADSGWKFKVDGKAVTPVKWANTFWSLPLASGTHHIEYYYQPDYVIYPFVLSATTLVLTLGGLYTYRKIKKRQLD